MAERVAGVLIVRNEAARLPSVVRSLRPLCDTILVIDGQSTDGTPAIAASLGCEVLSRIPRGSADFERQFAADKADAEWILMLDGDELLSPGLAEQLSRFLERPTADILALPRLNHVAGRPLVYGVGGAHSDHQMRFFRKGTLGFTSELHRFYQPKRGARIRRVPYRPGAAIVHFAKTDVSQMLGVLDRYTELEVLQAVPGKAPKPGRVARSLLALVAVYARRRGWKEGWRGFLELWMKCSYEVVRDAKIRLHQEPGGNRMAIEEAYRQEAQRLLSARTSEE